MDSLTKLDEQIIKYLPMLNVRKKMAVLQSLKMVVSGKQVEVSATRSKKQIKELQKKEKPIAYKNFKDFVDIWTSEEADEIKRIIEESCGQINPEDWK